MLCPMPCSDLNKKIRNHNAEHGILFHFIVYFLKCIFGSIFLYILLLGQRYGSIL